MDRPLAGFFAACLLAVSLSANPAALSVKVTGPKGETVADAVVALVPLDGPVPAPRADHVEIMQEDQQFAPYVTVVQAGTALSFPNRDTVQHHVYSVSKPKRFELPLYKPGNAEVVTFDEPGVVTLGCNIHDWMVAYLYVVPTPWFAKTGADGTATVPAPAARYRLEVSHPRLAQPVVQEVTLAGGTPQVLDLALKLRPDRRIRRAPDGKLGGY